MSCKYSLVYCLTKGFLKSTPFPWKILFPTFLDFPHKQLKILFHPSPISIFLALDKCLVCLFRSKIFWKIWYDFKIVSYFLFEKFHIILNIPTSWQYILLLCTKKWKKSWMLAIGFSHTYILQDSIFSDRKGLLNILSLA